MTKKAAKPSKRTSAPIAKIAGRVLARYEKRPSNSIYVGGLCEILWSDVVALAASCLSQTEPKAKKKIL